jgi:hypothetical protein
VKRLSRAEQRRRAKAAKATKAHAAALVAAAAAGEPLEEHARALVREAWTATDDLREVEAFACAVFNAAARPKRPGAEALEAGYAAIADAAERQGSEPDRVRTDATLGLSLRLAGVLVSFARFEVAPSAVIAAGAEFMLSVYTAQGVAAATAAGAALRALEIEALLHDPAFLPALPPRNGRGVLSPEVARARVESEVRNLLAPPS